MCELKTCRRFSAPIIWSTANEFGERMDRSINWCAGRADGARVCADEKPVSWLALMAYSHLNALHKNYAIAVRLSTHKTRRSIHMKSYSHCFLFVLVCFFLFLQMKTNAHVTSHFDSKQIASGKMLHTHKTRTNIYIYIYICSPPQIVVKCILFVFFIRMRQRERGRVGSQRMCLTCTRFERAFNRTKYKLCSHFAGQN